MKKLPIQEYEHILYFEIVQKAVQICTHFLVGHSILHCPM